MLNLPEEEIDRCQALIDSARVLRWHNQPTIPSQTTGQHSFSMLLLLIALHPNPSADLMQAIIRHDLAERICSDFPHHLKKRFPVLKDIDEQLQEEFDEEFGLAPLDLSVEDKLWVKLLDQLEVLMYVQECFAEPTHEAWTIYENCATISNDLIEQLQFFGYLKDPHETVQ